MNRPVFPSGDQLARREIFPGATISVAAGDGIMLSECVMRPHAVIERHSHPHEQAGMVLEGSALFHVGDEQKQLTPGNMYFIPGGVEHRVVAGPQGLRALDVFHPVREDYRPATDSRSPTNR